LPAANKSEAPLPPPGEIILNAEDSKPFSLFKPPLPTFIL
jgi:hypothetical protein